MEADCQELTSIGFASEALRKLVNEAVAAGTPYEEIVVLVTHDGELKLMPPGTLDALRRPGHFALITSIGQRDGAHYANVRHYAPVRAQA